MSQVELVELVKVGPEDEEELKSHGDFPSVQKAQERVLELRAGMPDYGFSPFRIIPKLKVVAGGHK